jgi:hypothetical protein
MAEEIPIGEDTRPKDRVKLGVSPSTIVEEMDCRKTQVVSSAYLAFIIADSHKYECMMTCGLEDWERYQMGIAMYESEKVGADI